MIDEYRDWLYQFIELNDQIQWFTDLLLYLSGKVFRWTVKRDEDRAKNGLALRTSFAMHTRCPYDFWVNYLPEQCTVLEMMIALAMSIDDVIYDPDYGDRTAVWFWKMIDNLGLGRMNKYDFDKDYCNEVIDRFLKRRYLRDGRGGLFTTRNPKIDMRKAEIWYQANIFLEENF